MYEAEFRRCLIELDVAGIRKIWAHVSPHLDQPKSDIEALTTLHLARTKAKSIPIRLKMYSQRWLNERGFGSFLQDDKRERRTA